MTKAGSLAIMIMFPSRKDKTYLHYNVKKRIFSKRGIFIEIFLYIRHSSKYFTYASLVNPHTYLVMHSEPVILLPPIKWRSIRASVGM